MIRKKDEIIAFGDDIWHHAELGYKEVRTAGKYCEWMKKLGLENEEGWAITGVKTYLNPKGSTEGPTLAVMGEMDALPIPNNKDAWNGNSHCCGHNAQLTGVVGAALALTDPEVKAALGGNICFMAVPAEEFVDITFKNQLMKEGKLHYGGGKCELIRVGAMDDIDIALGHHTQAGCDMSIMNGTSNGFINKTVTFTGRSAHAAGMPHHGVDALNAATSAMVNMALQQESYRDEDTVRVHYFIQDGGTAVNVIADHVTMQVCARAKTPEAYKDASMKVDRSLRAAAMATGCGLHIESMAGYMSEMANPHIDSDVSLYLDFNVIITNLDLVDDEQKKILVSNIKSKILELKELLNERQSHRQHIPNVGKQMFKQQLALVETLEKWIIDFENSLKEQN